MSYCQTFTIEFISGTSRDGNGRGDFRVLAPPLMGQDLNLINGFGTGIRLFF